VQGDTLADTLMLEDVLEGLALPQKEISPKYFYDTRGSKLFEEITRLEEYYPTRTELALLRRWTPEWVKRWRPAALVELGAGSARKSRVVLDAMTRAASGNLYVPVDVSGEFLHDTARRLREEYRDLRVEPEIADITLPLSLSVPLPEPAWFALLGSTLGNFDAAHAARLLRRIAGHLRPRDRFLVGVDLRPGPGKSVARLEAAYNDAHGVTAAFNRNVLNVLNRALGADFRPEAFLHRAFYHEAEGRIEMHLVACEPMEVRFASGHVVPIRAGETLRTEISCKYDAPSIEALFAEAGLRVSQWVEDEEGLFALILAKGEA